MGSVLEAWTDWLKECAFIMKDPPFTQKATGIKKQLDFLLWPHHTRAQGMTVN